MKEEITTEEVQQLENVPIGDKDTFEVDFDFESGNILVPDEIKNEKPTKSEKPDDSEESKEELKEKFNYDPEEVIEKSESEIEDNEVEDSNPYSVWADTLVQSELLELEEGQTIETEEDLKEATERHLSKILNSWADNVDKKSHGALTHFLNDGSVEEFVKTFSNQSIGTPSYKEDEIADNDTAKQEIAEAYYKSKGFSGKRLKKQIDNSVDLDEDSDFIEMQNELNEIDKNKKLEFEKQAKQREENKQKQAEEYRKSVYDGIVNTNEFIPGRKIDKKTREKIYENTQETMVKINKNLPKYVPTLAFLDYYGLLDGNFDKVLKEVETKNVTSLSEVLKAGAGKKKSSSKAKDERTNSLFEDAVASLKRK